MLDPPLDRLVVRFAHDDVDVPGVVVDQRLAQGRAIGNRRVIGFTLLHWQEH
jgi:hypothetical protein